DVVLDQPSLVTAGDGDGGVAVVQAMREVAAGGRRPAGAGQFADVVDQQLGQFAQARGVVREGGGVHGGYFTGYGERLSPSWRRRTVEHGGRPGGRGLRETP